MPPLPIEVLAKVFPFLRDDPKSWYSLAHCNRELHHISKALRPPRKWPDLLVNWELAEEQDFDYYVDQVKYSPLGRHVALMLRVYQGREANDYQRLIRVIDNDDGKIQDILVGRSAPFTAYCGHYLVTVAPRHVYVYDYSSPTPTNDIDMMYRLVQVLPSADRIVGMKLFHNAVTKQPQIALQTEAANNDNNQLTRCNLAIWDLLQGRLERELPYTGTANFCISDDNRVFACIDGGPDGRSVTTYYLHYHNASTLTNRASTSVSGPYISELPGNPRRSWIDTCKFSPDGRRLAVLTEERIFQMDTSVEPPEWIQQSVFVAPDGCTFSGQMEYTPDSQRFLAHARTPWQQNLHNDDNDNLNTIQIWNAVEAPYNLIATKGFHDLVGSVGLSPDGKFVIVIQGDESDVFRSPIARIVARYVAAMDDYTPYPITGDVNEEEEQHHLDVAELS